VVAVADLIGEIKNLVAAWGHRCGLGRMSGQDLSKVFQSHGNFDDFFLIHRDFWLLDSEMPKMSDGKLQIPPGHSVIP